MDLFELDKRSREIAEMQDPDERALARAKHIITLYNCSCSALDTVLFRHDPLSFICYTGLLMALMPMILFAKVYVWIREF